MSNIKVKKASINYVLKIVESVLKFKTYEDRDEVLRVAQSMARTAIANDKYSQEVKDSYLKAFEEIQTLTFENMQEIIKIITIRDGGTDDDEDEE